MNVNHALQCRCGTLKGQVAHAEAANRGVCYCKDCQAFARFLGHADEILDESGGTDVIATLASNVTITAGASALACMSLTDNGLLRWYARCCNTPVGNTTRNFRLSYVGLVHNCLEKPGQPLDAVFGPVRMRVNTQSATRGRPSATPLATLAAVLRLMTSIGAARLDGSYRRTPFFDTQRGTPVVTPNVISRAERDRLRNAA
jgi:hypothetical protein